MEIGILQQLKSSDSEFKIPLRCSHKTMFTRYLLKLRPPNFNNLRKLKLIKEYKLQNLQNVDLRSKNRCQFISAGPSMNEQTVKIF